MSTGRFCVVAAPLLAAAGLAGCSVGFGMGVGVTIPVGGRRPKAVYVREPDETEWGKATYFSRRYHGRVTASGEAHDAGALTAAHRSLPFGTMVRVRRLDMKGGPSVTVRINDRAVSRGYVVRLSAAAAAAIGLNRTGPATVGLKVASPPAAGAAP